MVGWHHQLNGREFEQTLGDSEGQGSLACCSPWGRQDWTRLSDRTTKRFLAGGFHQWLQILISWGNFEEKCTYPGPIPVPLNQNLWMVPKHWYLKKSAFPVIPLGISTESPATTQKDAHTLMDIGICFHYTEPKNVSSLISHQASSRNSRPEPCG